MTSGNPTIGSSKKALRATISETLDLAIRKIALENRMQRPDYTLNDTIIDLLTEGVAVHMTQRAIRHHKPALDTLAEYGD